MLHCSLQRQSLAAAAANGIAAPHTRLQVAWARKRVCAPNFCLSHVVGISQISSCVFLNLKNCTNLQSQTDQQLWLSKGQTTSKQTRTLIVFL